MLPVIFLLITFCSLALFYFGTGKAPVVLFVFLPWLTLVGSITFTGYFQHNPAHFAAVIVASVLISIFLYRRIRIGKLDTRLLLAVHCIRVPVELILYRLWLYHKIPVLMTFGGWNFDIMAGLSAIALLAYLLVTKRNIGRKFFIAWNIAGILLLTTIVLIALFSSPLPIQLLAFDQPNTALLVFPYVYLPAVVVPVVYLSHFLTIKHLRANAG